MWTKSIKMVNRITEVFCATLLFAMVAIIFLQIISRLVLQSSFPWTEEVARFMMIWITFLGTAFAFQYGAHIGVEVFVAKFPKILRSFVQILVGIICFSFFLLLIVKGYELAAGSLVQTSPALNIPMGYVYAVIPVSGVLMALNLIDVTIKSMFQKNGKLKEI
jgi:TRAP-type transport system small permease protein